MRSVVRVHFGPPNDDNLSLDLKTQGIGSSNLIASILGILKAGCAFIPIDPEYPQDRINYIYENSQADYIISNEAGEM